MAKKKLYFYTLVIIFTFIATLALLDAWGTRNNEGNSMSASQTPSMMSQSMGNMMASMHLKNITLSDLLTVSTDNQSKMNTSSQNHHSASEETHASVLSRILTGTILVLLPFIVAGAIFLSIVWFR